MIVQDWFWRKKQGDTVFSHCDSANHAQLLLSGCQVLLPYLTRHYIMAKESVAHAANSTARSIRAARSVLKISGVASLLPGTHESIAVRVCRQVPIAR